MKFRFPIVIIDEDYRSENTSGLGIRALAEAIQKEGFEVLGADIVEIDVDAIGGTLRKGGGELARCLVALVV
jgi:molybdopterin biosynthesis enzyme MoaB